MLRHHPNGTGTNFRRKFVRRFACHRPYFSRIGVSGKPGAVQHAWLRNLRHCDEICQNGLDVLLFKQGFASLKTVAGNKASKTFDGRERWHSFHARSHAILRVSCQEHLMTRLKDLAIEAHGGLQRWLQFEQVSADLVQGGVLWPLKGHPQTLEHTTVTVGLKTEWASHAPFGSDNRRSRFEPGRVALEAEDGTVLEELLQPRASFAGHTLQTPWTELQLAYFAGCAMWTYLNIPFLLAWPGVETEELEPSQADGADWRRLAVRFPTEIATHSAVQTLYFDGDGLLKRHDYDVEIAGNTPGAHIIDRYEDVSGIKFPTRRRIHARQPDSSFTTDPLVVSIDLWNIRLG
ncbi:conserved hypothetical protein [Agrobacterium sp. NCPPB 925]|nr:conserved hypothetical protein [Agrobacterium sp. NCPPB 925]